MKINFVDTVHPVLSTRLTVAGHTCEDLGEYEGAALMAQLHDSEGLIVRSRLFIDDEVLDHAPKLRFIARCGAGMENIDKEACAKRGIVLYNSPEGNRTSVAEHAVGMLLALMNHLPKADREVRHGIWDRTSNSGNELRGSQVGIIGFGSMGAALARCLAGFGVKLLAHDKYRRGFANAQVEEVSLEELQERSDVVSIHLPLTSETGHYANAEFFKGLAKPVWFINTARGPITDTAALLDAIDEGRVRGACLDVLEFEQRSLKGLRSEADNKTLERLYACDKVLLSPHVAGITAESYFKLANVLADKILVDIAQGKFER